MYVYIVSTTVDNKYCNVISQTSWFDVWYYKIITCATSAGGTGPSHMWQSNTKHYNFFLNIIKFLYETNNTWNTHKFEKTFMSLKTVITYILNKNILHLILCFPSKNNEEVLKSLCENVFTCLVCTYVHIPVGGTR